MQEASDHKKAEELQAKMEQDTIMSEKKKIQELEKKYKAQGTIWQRSPYNSLKTDKDKLEYLDRLEACDYQDKLDKEVYKDSDIEEIAQSSSKSKKTKNNISELPAYPDPLMEEYLRNRKAEILLDEGKGKEPVRNVPDTNPSKKRKIFNIEEQNPIDIQNYYNDKLLEKGQELSKKEMKVRNEMADFSKESPDIDFSVESPNIDESDESSSYDVYDTNTVNSDDDAETIQEKLRLQALDDMLRQEKSDRDLATHLQHEEDRVVNKDNIVNLQKRQAELDRDLAIRSRQQLDGNININHYDDLRVRQEQIDGELAIRLKQETDRDINRKNDEDLNNIPESSRAQQASKRKKDIIDSN